MIDDIYYKNEYAQAKTDLWESGEPGESSAAMQQLVSQRYRRLDEFANVAASHALFRSDFLPYVKALQRVTLDDMKQLSLPHFVTTENLRAYVRMFRDGLRTINEALSLQSYSIMCKYLIETSDFTESVDQFFMRVALAVSICAGDSFKKNLRTLLETFVALQTQVICMPTPTNRNAGKRSPQLSSCFIMSLHPAGVVDFTEIELIARNDGGIGVDLGRLSGVELLTSMRRLSAHCSAIKQSTRPAAFVVAINMCNASTLDFLSFTEMASPPSNIQLGMRQKFLSMADTDMWYFFTEKQQREAYDLYGEAFDVFYDKHVDPAVNKGIRVADMWRLLGSRTQQTPPLFLSNIDEINARYPLRRAGSVKCGNLCMEIYQHFDEVQTAQCTLANIVLTKCIVNGRFMFSILAHETRRLVRVLNNVIDAQAYPTERVRCYVREYRNIACGVSGMHDVFIRLRIQPDSLRARLLDTKIFMIMYKNAVKESNTLAKMLGLRAREFAPHDLERGVFHYDAYEHTTIAVMRHESATFDRFWKRYSRSMNALRPSLRRHGVRNGLLLALMPTATTSQMNNVSDNCELIASPYQASTNYTTRVNMAMADELRRWGVDLNDREATVELIPGVSVNIVAEVVRTNSVQWLPQLQARDNDELAVERAYAKRLLRVASEYSPFMVVDFARARQPFIDQGQSTVYFLAKEDNENDQARSVEAVLRYAAGDLTRRSLAGPKCLALDASDAQCRDDYDIDNYQPSPKKRRRETLASAPSLKTLVYYVKTMAQN